MPYSNIQSFFFFFNFIYLFIYLWLSWVFISVRGPSPVVASGGHPSSRCAGLPPSRPLSLRGTGSRRAGSATVAHGPNRSAACGILPDQGSNPCPLHWQEDSQPLRHQGSPSNIQSWWKLIWASRLGDLKWFLKEKKYRKTKEAGSLESVNVRRMENKKHSILMWTRKKKMTLWLSIGFKVILRIDQQLNLKYRSSTELLRGWHGTG